MINYQYLKKQLGEEKQNLYAPYKCFKELEEYLNYIVNTSQEHISGLISVVSTEYKIRVNNSARYFVVGTQKELNRTGYFDIYAKDKQSFYKLYLLINSSYVYWFFRMYDGGILLPKSTLLKMPIPDFELSQKQKYRIEEIINSEDKYLVYKINAGKTQESVKFPVEIRNELNEMLGLPKEIELIHKNNETLAD